MAVDKTYLSKQIKKRRVDKEWSQKDLSKASGVSTAAITNCERKRSVPTYETLQRIATAFNCSVADLTGEGRHRSFSSARRDR